jgi:hypothetical protein
LQSAIDLGPSFHGLPFAASALLNGRTRIVTEIFSISSIKKLNLQAQIGRGDIFALCFLARKHTLRKLSINCNAKNGEKEKPATALNS